VHHGARAPAAVAYGGRRIFLKFFDLPYSFFENQRKNIKNFKKKNRSTHAQQENFYLARINLSRAEIGSRTYFWLHTICPATTCSVERSEGSQIQHRNVVRKKRMETMSFDVAC
jgi:hypothetical protein